MNTSVKLLIGIVTAAVLAGVILGFFLGPYQRLLGQARPERPAQEGAAADSQALSMLQGRQRPVIELKQIPIKAGAKAAAKDFLESAVDADGQDLTALIKASGKQVDPATGVFCAEKPGIYFIYLFVSDSHGLTARRTATILVNEERVTAGGAS